MCWGQLRRGPELLVGGSASAVETTAHGACPSANPRQPRSPGRAPASPVRRVAEEIGAIRRVNASAGVRVPRRTVFETVVDNSSAQIRAMIERAKGDLASRHELELLQHVLSVIETMDDRTRPAR